MHYIVIQMFCLQIKNVSVNAAKFWNYSGMFFLFLLDFILPSLKLFRVEWMWTHSITLSFQ